MLPVPKVLEAGEKNDREYMIMSVLERRHIETYAPLAYVKYCANALLMLQAVDITRFKDKALFNVSLDMRLKELKFLLENGLADTNVEHWECGSGFANAMDLYAWLCANKPKVEELCFSHGDLAGNVFIKQGKPLFYDVGRAGIACKWMDIALCVREIRKLECANLSISSKELEKIFFQLLNVEMDNEKIQYYILLDEMF